MKHKNKFMTIYIQFGVKRKLRNLNLVKNVRGKFSKVQQKTKYFLKLQVNTTEPTNDMKHRRHEI